MVMYVNTKIASNKIKRLFVSIIVCRINFMVRVTIANLMKKNKKKKR